MRKFRSILLLISAVFTFQNVISQNRVIVNGGFENPVFTGSFFVANNAPSTVPGTRIPGWNSTQDLIELQQFTTGGGVSAVGSQHVELNSNAVSRIYQNMFLVFGENLPYSYYHRGRLGIDVMQFNIYDISGSTKLAIIDSSYADTLVWQFNSGSYKVNVPTGNYQVSFESISAAGGKPGFGNLVDEINISLPPLVTFTKPYFSAAENTISLPDIKVSGIVPAGGLTITFSANLSNASAGSDYTLSNLIIPAGQYTFQSDSFPIPLTIINDNILELDENIAITINSLGNGLVTTNAEGIYSTTYYTILNDDTFDAGPNQTVCPGDSVVVNATGRSSPTWNKGILQGKKFASHSTTTSYTVRDSIITNNLILNPDFSLGNSGFESQYQYDSRSDSTFNSVFLHGGDYNVVANPHLSSKYQADIGDHTTGAGNMMNVDGSSVANLIIWRQTIGVAPNTDYVFSIWVNSFTGISPPVIQSSINGQNLGNTFTPSNNQVWEQFSQTWNSGANTVADIKIISNNLNSFGNDFAFDDIFFGGIIRLSDSLKIIITAPSAPTTKDIDTCQQAGNYTLTASGTNLVWYDSISGNSGRTTIAPVISLNLPDTLTKWVSQTINGCEGPRSSLKISVRKTPGLPIVKSLDTCQTPGSYTVQATGSGLKWYNTSSGGTSSNIAPVIDLNVPDTISYWVSQTLNGCEGPRGKADVMVKLMPLAPVTSNFDTCQTTGTYSLKASGTGLGWYTTATSGSRVTTTPSFNLNIPVNTTRWVSQTLNGCEGPRSKIDISIGTTLPAPIVKSLDTCQAPGSYTVQATGSGLKWYNTSSGGTASNIAPVIDLNVPDTISYWVSQTLNGCEGPRGKADVMVKLMPLAPVTSNLDTCQTTGTYSLKASGTGLGWYTTATSGSRVTTTPSFNLNVPVTTAMWVSQTLNGCEGPRSKIDVSIGTTSPAPTVKSLDTCQAPGSYTVQATGSGLNWYSTSSGGTASNITPVIDLNVPDTISYWVSQTLNGCEGPRGKADVMIKVMPLAPVTSNLDTCQATGTYSLKASGTGLGWYTTATSGSRVTTTPSFNLNIPDTTAMWATQTLNGCESKRSKIDVAIRTIPGAPNVKNIDTCQQTGSISPVAIGTNLKWYDFSSGGTASTIVPVFDLNIPTNTSKWVSQGFNGCEGPRAQLTIKIKTPPSPPSVVNLDTCQTAGNYSAKAIGTNLAWYDLQSGGTGSTTAPAFDLNLPDTTFKWVTQTSNGCESARVKSTFSIKVLPVVPITKDVSVCQSSGTITLTATGSQLKWYNAASGGTTVAQPDFSLSVADTVSLWVSQTIQLCEGPRSKITLSVKSMPAAPIVKDTTLCQKVGSLDFKATGANLLWYSSGSLTGSGLTPSVNTNIVQNTTHQVSQTVNGCESAKSTESIQINNSPGSPAGIDQVICESAGTISYLASGSALQWYTDPTINTFTTVVPSINRNNIGINNAYVSQTINSCESSRTLVKITINALPASPVIPDVKYCFNDSAKPLTSLKDSLLWYNAATGGTGSTQIPTPNTQNVTVKNYWVSLVVKGCESLRANVKTTVNPLPAVFITAISDGAYCSKTKLIFNPTGAVNYDWISPNGLHSAQSNLIIPSFATNDAGKYVLKGTDLNQCSSKDSVFLTIKYPPAITALPLAVCEKEPVFIHANTSGIAFWKLPGNRLQNSSDLYLPISHYADNGRYVIISSRNGCTDSLEVLVSVTNCKPKANDDVYTAFLDQDLILNAQNHPINNDSDPNDKLHFEDLSFITQPIYGKLSREPNGYWTYKVSSEIDAVEILEYQICDRGLPVLCDNAKVEIHIKKREAFLPDAFTPNGDGINDYYTVYYLSPQVKVALNVFNRWGDVVYQNVDYKNDWAGICSVGSCQGAELPVGTYFLVAELSNGVKYTTHLTLNR